jgi:hypothetical protein
MHVLLGWRGGVASVVFVTGVLALDNHVLHSPMFFVMSLLGLAAAMWFFDPDPDQGRRARWQIRWMLNRSPDTNDAWGIGIALIMAASTVALVVAALML